MGIRNKRKKVDLQTGAITARTKYRYDAAIERFGYFLSMLGLGVTFAIFAASDLAKNPFDVDHIVATYLQFLYDNDFPRHFGRDLLTVLPKRLLHVRRHLSASWGAMNTWERMEPPRRAEPIGPAHVVLLMYHVLALASFRFQDYIDLVSLAVCFGLMFHCMLRPSEAMGIQRSDIVFNSDSASICLNHSKTTSRKNAREFVSVEDPLIFLVLRLYCEAFDAVGRPDNGFLFCFEFGDFAELLQAACIATGLAILGLQPYSFRRGGATFDFEIFRSFDRLCERGRWLHARNARIYVEDAVAARARQLLEAQTRTAISDARLAMTYFLLHKVGNDGKKSLILSTL